MGDSVSKHRGIDKGEMGFGLVGTGTIAASHVRAIHANQGAKLIGVFSESVFRGKDWAARYGITHYPTYDELLNDPRVDIVDIANKTHLHAEYAIRAVEHEKHVLVEKPLDARLDKAEKLVRLAEERHRTLSCVSEFRFSPGIRSVRERMERNALGKIHTVNVSIPLFRTMEYFTTSPWRSKSTSAGGGVLAMNAIHVLDLLLWLFGPVQTVHATKLTLRQGIEVEDCAAVLMKFENDILCVMSATTSAGRNMPLRIEIHGTDGSVELQDFVMVDRWSLVKDPLFLLLRKAKKRLWKEEPLMELCFYYQIKDIIDAVKEGIDPLTSGDAGFEALALLNKIYDACESGV